MTLEVKLPEVHTSDRIAFKRCRRKWDLGSYQRQNYIPDRINDKLWLGTGIHYALSEYYEKGEPLVEAFTRWSESEILRIKATTGLWDEQMDMINETIDLGVGMLDHYAKWCRVEDDKYFKKVIHTEMEFTVPIVDLAGLPTGYNYTGRIDGIVEDEYGAYWLLEHKTAANTDTTKLPLDEQVGSYLWAAQQIYGLRLEGVIYNVLRKRVPRVPDVLKNGNLSTNKSIDTTYEVYLGAVEDHYAALAKPVPIDSFQDVLAHLYEKGNTFFVRERVRRNQYEIKSQGERIYHELLDMIRPDLVLYPNPTKDCSWDCDFRSVCMAMEDGSDPEYLLSSLFKRREGKADSSFDENTA